MIFFFFALRSLRLCVKLTAVDIQKGMLDIIMKKAESADLHNIRYINAGLGEGKLEKSYYDRALLITVLGEIPNKNKALEEIFRALKPEGMLSVTETIFDPHYQSKESVLQLAMEIGFAPKGAYGNKLAYTILLSKPV